MKKVIKLSLFSLVMAGLMVLGINSAALAAGTISGTNISNTATIEYEVNAAAQTPIDSVPATFVVDNKVDLMVTEDNTTWIQVLPNAADQVMAFTVANNGNTTQDFAVTVLNNPNDPFGGTENFDATTVQVFVDSNDNGTYELSDTDTFVDELAPDDSIKVFVVADIPAIQASGDIDVYTLTATALAGGGPSAIGAGITESGGADDPAVVDIVFADGAGDTDADRDASFSDTGSYQVMAAQLTITKTASVIRDPFNLGANPKSIPGAYIQYVITVSNAAGAGSSSATLTTITDDLGLETVFDEDFINGTSGNPESGTAGLGFMVEWSGTARANDGTPQYFTAYTGDGVSHDNSATGGTVTAAMATVLPSEGVAPNDYSAGELKPGESVTITFNVIVQ